MHHSAIKHLELRKRRLHWPKRTDLRSLSIALLGCALAVLGVLGCASEVGSAGDITSPTAASFDRPPLYRVDGGDGADLIMLGTIHPGPAQGWSLSPEANAALQEASAFVLELDPRQASEDAIGTLVANMVMLEPPASLESVLRPETAKLLEERSATVTAMGLSPSVRRHMKPWFIAAGLIDSATASSGYSTSQGVESLLVAQLGERPLIPLETVEFQLRIFDDLPFHLQDLMLYDTLLRLDETEAGIEELIQAWRNGDEQTLEQIARQGIDELPELEPFYERLLDARNRNWLTQLIPMLQDATRRDETILVGVGALHLVGPESVPSLLRKAGYSVSRIPQTEVKP